VVGNLLQEMRYAIESCAFLTVGIDYIPGLFFVSVWANISSLARE
jgi:hypothetical protein